MSAEIYNGIVRPDGVRIAFEIPVEGVKVDDIKTINHPARNARNGSKGLFATQAFSAGDYIGSYGGEIKRAEEDGVANWNPYQLTPDPEGDYYIDGLAIGNELRYCNDPRGTDKQPNAQFYQSDAKVGGYYVCDVYAIEDISPGDEILVSYGDGYWESLQAWYEHEHPHECPHCDARYDTPKGRTDHIWAAHKKKSPDVEFPCDKCDRSFARKQSLVDHINAIHDKTTVHKCDYPGCNYTSFNLRTIYQHKRKAHLFLHYKCFACDRTFTSRPGYNAHIAAAHKKMTYRCDCGKEYTTWPNLLRHKRITHDGVKPYTCDRCGDKFASKVNRDEHISAVHDKLKLNKCAQCGETFSALSNLMRHVKIVHEGVKKFTCDECGSAFGTKNDLERHAQRHRDEYKFTCDVCEKEFKTKTDLTKHAKRHSTERKYKCSKCDWAFNESGNLRRHERNIHGGAGKVNPKKPPKVRALATGTPLKATAKKRPRKDNDAIDFEIVVEIKDVDVPPPITMPPPVPIQRKKIRAEAEDDVVLYDC